jgi:hypothetical protein
MKCVENFAPSYIFPICMKSIFLSSELHVHAMGWYSSIEKLADGGSAYFTAWASKFRVEWTP